MKETYNDIINDLLSGWRKFNFPVEQVTLRILEESEGYEEEEILREFSRLPPDIQAVAKSMVEDFRKTNEYYDLSNFGARNVSKVMERASKYIET